MTDLKTRKHKINFLNDLSKGAKSIFDLLPEEICFIVCMKDQNGIMKHSLKGKELTEEEYLIYKKKHPRIVRIIVKNIETKRAIDNL